MPGPASPIGAQVNICTLEEIDRPTPPIRVSDGHIEFEQVVADSQSTRKLNAQSGDMQRFAVLPVA